MDAKEFGAKLKEIRKEKKLTLLDLKARTGYSDSYLSQIENGHKDMPKPALIRTLAVGLDISHIYLLRLAGYSDSYIDVENGSLRYEGNDPLKNDNRQNKKRTIDVELPCTEKINMETEEQTIRELTDDELRRRLFDFHDLLSMEIDLYYKNEFLTDEKRNKVRKILELIFE
ncbi:helix-turn-helix domain-containing protein [Halalkalibacter sp. APA_J-10(15)]|uniref:helix-turn-helix domain-containing protein n=1 Tax=Halalkalibacter sp. APA_J-10(15) TaxID=2933805 RepID=UPI001FF2F407|nr:helix-turn-helix transcriptional regulator [Halalkalibacter sp. APA_J-10(15)]MCK0473362.1 helix-turn-helix domain-containing protein [Halalkalibacter sp. APA_J-10(15)]